MADHPGGEGTISARFDDLRPRRWRSFQMVGLVEVLEAGDLAEVGPVLAAAEERVGEGRWVAGFVTYEAAPAFDPALRVVDSTGSEPRELPLAWFSVWEGRSPTTGLSGSPYDLGSWRPDLDPGQYRAAVDGSGL